MSDDDDAWMDELVPPGAKLKRQDAEIDRLQAELDKATRIVGTSLHSDIATERIKLENDHLRTEVVCLRCEIDWRGEEIKRLRQKLMNQSADPGSDGG